MKMKYSQKLAFKDVVESKGLPGSMFEFEESEASNSEQDFFKIRYRPIHEYTFYISLKRIKTIRHFQEVFFVSYTPAEDKYSETNNCIDFEEILTYFEIWIDYLTEEVNAMQLWNEWYDGSTSNFNGTEFFNGDFTEKEIEILQVKVLELKSKCRELVSDTEKFELIDNKLDTVIEQLSQMNKFDWRSFFIGTIFNLLQALSIDKNTGNQILNLVQTFFTNLLK
ncbi:MAG: hypothetical protein K1X91_10140 [Bacteriodetes bacterium]|nr:hypothetical protein [Bacteroidota bacterium]